jgi:hypothetical protein
MNEIIGYTSPSANGGSSQMVTTQMCGGGGGGGGSTGMPQYDPQSDPDIPVPCDMLVACADGTAEQACFQTFAPLCTGHGGVIGDPFNRYQEQEEAETIFVRCNDGSFDTLRRNGVKPCLTRGGEVEEFDTRTDAQREADLAEIRAGWEGGSESGGDGDRPVSQGGMIPDDVYYGVAMSNEMFPDDLMVQQPVEDDACAGVRCIKLYKPCPEGYIDVSKCCPNTGNCALDPDYVFPNVGLVQMQPIGGIAAPALPIGNTPSTEFQLDGVDEMNQPIRMEIPVRSSTPLPFERTTTAPTTSTTEPLTAETSTTETSTAEEPKEGGLGILVLGLIALEALAT